MKSIHICKSCKIYTMKEKCPSCSKKTSIRRPPKYSPEDKYGKYRRMALESSRKEEGLI